MLLDQAGEYFITANAKDDEQAESALGTFGFSTLASGLAITEIMYQPILIPGCRRFVIAAWAWDWVEIANVSGIRQALGNVRLRVGPRILGLGAMVLDPGHRVMVSNSGRITSYDLAESGERLLLEQMC